MNAAPLALDGLLTDFARRPIGLERMEFEKRRVSIAEVERFRESIATPPAADPIDELVAELRAAREGVML